MSRSRSQKEVYQEHLLCIIRKKVETFASADYIYNIWWLPWQRQCNLVSGWCFLCRIMILLLNIASGNTLDFVLLPSAYKKLQQLHNRSVRLGFYIYCRPWLGQDAYDLKKKVKI